MDKVPIKFSRCCNAPALLDEREHIKTGNIVYICTDCDNPCKVEVFGSDNVNKINNGE
jgi:hypothetical protein